jgi:hypothetical protein
MLKANFDPLARPFDDVLDKWMSEYRGHPIRVNFRELVGANSGVDRFTHLMHPYPAKLLFNIPLFFLNCSELATPGGYVYDPFCGSGTVLLEGLVAGHRVVGCDTNPLARLIAAAKTTVLPASSLEESCKTVLDHIPRRGEGIPTGSLNLERWFSASVLRKLDRLATALRRLPTSPEKRFLEACFSATILRVSLTDPTISVPVRLNPSKSSLTKSQRGERRQWLKHRLEADVTAEFLAVVQLNIGRMGRLYDHLSASSSSVAIGYDSRATTTTPIDLVITSPPYGSAQKYIRASSLALQWLGLAPNGLRDLERQSIGREHFNSDELQSEIPLMTSSQRSTIDCSYESVTGAYYCNVSGRNARCLSRDYPLFTPRRSSCLGGRQQFCMRLNLSYTEIPYPNL